MHATMTRTAHRTDRNQRAYDEATTATMSINTSSTRRPSTSCASASELSPISPSQEVPNPAQAGLLHALALAQRATELDSQAEYHLALDAYQSAIGSIYRVLLAAVGSSTGIDEVSKKRLEAIVGSYEDRVTVLQSTLQ